MSSIFCPSCGAKAEYQFSAPNFCSKCGRSYSNSFSTQKPLLRSTLKAKIAQKNQEPEDPNEEFEEDENLDSEDDVSYSNVSRVPRLRKIDVEIDSQTDVRIFKFENFLDNAQSNFTKPKKLDLGNS